MLALSRYALVLGVSCSPALASADAQQFPAKTITLVVPAAPGGVTDLIARALGQRFRESFGQPVVVENKPGASNQIAAEYVARSSADGYTLLVSPGSDRRHQSLFCSASFITMRQRISCRLPAWSKFIRPWSPIASVPAHNVADLIALAKKAPGTLNYGTYGVGSTGHLNMEMFESDGRACRWWPYIIRARRRP